ncbi:hypothetical protein ES703_85139 [subsurface metagenome]
MQKTVLLLTIVLTTISSIAVGKAVVNYRREILLRDKKIEGLLDEFEDVQKQTVALKEQLTVADANILDKVNIGNLDKKNYSYRRDERKGIPAAEWIATQDELIKNLEKDLKIIQKDMLILIHYASSAGVKIPKYALKTIPTPPPYINPNWQDDYSIGAVADVYKIKIFQQQEDKLALVEVQYKAPMRQALRGWIDVSPYISLPQTEWVAINRNTPKDIKFYGGMQRNNKLVDVPVNYEGKWTIMQFRGFDLGSYSDGQKVELDKRCIIVDTTTYQTAIGGSNTVFVVEPFMANLR